jgi:hypothetical protein
VEASVWEATGMPIKSGSEVAERIFRRITAHRDRLLNTHTPTHPHTHTSAHAPNAQRPAPNAPAVWLHDGPTYWVRALSFPPNEGLPAGRSDHYHCIRAGTLDEARVMAAVLSSSTFYFFFKMVSNCRDLGWEHWSRFPLDPLPEGLKGRLARLGERLEARVRETARTRRRVYPSGEVRYREYYPATAKTIIDRIDAVLAEHYGFTDEDLAFIINYDLAYRMGKVGAADRDGG